MKNCVFFFIAMINIFSFSCFAQQNERISNNSEKGNTSIQHNDLANNKDYVVVGYHVVEKVKGNITTYDVSNLSLIDKNDLGPNNTRVITPKYGKVKTEAASKTKAVANQAQAASIITPAAIVSPIVTPPVIASLPSAVSPVQVETTASGKKVLFVMVDILSTYERILTKGGYESEEMLKKVADMRYFKGDLDIAYKWYSQLFALTTDLDIVYYYRYAQALKSVGQPGKANAMIKIFESKKIPK